MPMVKLQYGVSRVQCGVDGKVERMMEEEHTKV